MRFGDLGQPERGEIGVSEFEKFWSQREMPAFQPHVAELDESVEEAPRRGAIEAREPGHIAEGQSRMLAVERTHHRKATLETADEGAPRRVGFAIAVVGWIEHNGLVAVIRYIPPRPRFVALRGCRSPTTTGRGAVNAVARRFGGWRPAIVSMLLRHPGQPNSLGPAPLTVSRHYSRRQPARQETPACEAPACLTGHRRSATDVCTIRTCVR